LDEERQALDQFWMQHAIELAQQAESLDEVPVGAVIVKDDQVVGEGFNAPISAIDPTAHAEMTALRMAALHVGNYRLVDTTLYVTLEPCLMCVGAIIHARISCVVFGAREPKTGAAGSAFDLLTSDKHNHRLTVRSGVLAEQCASLMTDFFSNKRR